MLVFELQKLISTLSATEKKHFQLYCAKLQGPKDYFELYKLAQGDIATVGTWEKRFRQAHPGKSFDNAAQYLFKVLTDVLVQVRIEQDPSFAQHHYLLKAKLCLERSMPSRAQKMLKKAYAIATEHQNHSVAYQALRMESTALADLGFPGMDEQKLVDKQMKAKLTLQSLRQLHEHYSLYELLSYRLVKGALAIDEENDKKINDLILSELSLTNRGSQYEFEPQKLHLLFQSFFFIHTGDYRSSLRVFNELNKLFDANRTMWDFPPYDYLSTLNGILDSLRSIGYYQDMVTFIGNAKVLSNGDYPEHFRTLARLTADTYQLNMYLGTGQIDDALQFLANQGSDKSATTSPERHEIQLEYEFFESLAFFHAKQWKRANKSIHRLLVAEKHHKHLLVYRAARLLHILVAYEQDELEYLDYEIRSYKRTFSKFGKAYKTEKLLFNTISSDPPRRGKYWKERNWGKVNNQAGVILTEKRERQLLKYFEFTAWAAGKYGA